MKNPLDTLRAHPGTMRWLADKLEVTRQSIYQWTSIPDGRALEVERYTRGLVSAMDVLEYNLLQRRFHQQGGVERRAPPRKSNGSRKRAQA